MSSTGWHNPFISWSACLCSPQHQFRRLGGWPFLSFSLPRPSLLILNPSPRRSLLRPRPPDASPLLAHQTLYRIRRQLPPLLPPTPPASASRRTQSLPRASSAPPSITPSSPSPPLGCRSTTTSSQAIQRTWALQRLVRRRRQYRWSTHSGQDRKCSRRVGR